MSAFAKTHPQPGAFGRAHARWRVVDFNAETVWIEDLDGTISVTNDAEYVCATVFKTYGERHIVYKDSDGRWDELEHRGGRFIRYAPAREPAPVT